MDSALDVRRLHFAFTITFHNNFIHAARVLGDACDKLRRFSVEGTKLNRTHIDEMLGRSLMLVTALTSGYIDEKRFDEIVDPRKMVGHGVAGS